jgi:hypothetical protein
MIKTSKTINRENFPFLYDQHIFLVDDDKNYLDIDGYYKFNNNEYKNNKNYRIMFNYNDSLKIIKDDNVILTSTSTEFYKNKLNFKDKNGKIITFRIIKLGDIDIKFNIKIVPDETIRDDVEIYYYQPIQYKSFGRFNQYIGVKNKTDMDIGFNIELKNSESEYKKVLKCYDNESNHYTVKSKNKFGRILNYELFTNLLDDLETLSIDKDNVLNYKISLTYNLTKLSNNIENVPKLLSEYKNFPFLYDTDIYLYVEKKNLGLDGHYKFNVEKNRYINNENETYIYFKNATKMFIVKKINGEYKLSGVAYRNNYNSNDWKFKVGIYYNKNNLRIIRASDIKIKYKLNIKPANKTISQDLKFDYNKSIQYKKLGNFYENIRISNSNSLSQKIEFIPIVSPIDYSKYIEGLYDNEEDVLKIKKYDNIIGKREYAFNPDLLTEFNKELKFSANNTIINKVFEVNYLVFN